MNMEYCHIWSGYFPTLGSVQIKGGVSYRGRFVLW